MMSPKPWILWGRLLFRIIRDAVRAFVRHHGFIRASALTYTTLLAMIPSMILLSSIAGAMGIFDYASTMIPQLDALLEIGLPINNILPLLEQAGKMSFGSMGVVGSIGLLITFIAAMGNLEANFNVVWGVFRNRKPWMRLLVYLPFLLLALAFGACLSLYVHILRVLADQLLSGYLDSRLLGWANRGLWMGGIAAFLVLGQFLVYWLMPNTRVSPKAAIISSVTSLGLLYLLSKLAFQIQSLAFDRFSLLYGSLAFIPILMISVYIVWSVILFGNALCWRIQQGAYSILRPLENDPGFEIAEQVEPPRKGLRNA